MPTRSSHTAASRRAAIYCRISSDPSLQAIGVTRQLEDCTALVAARGWVLTDTYTDDDVSAYSGRQRPEYTRLLRTSPHGVRAQPCRRRTTHVFGIQIPISPVVL